MLYLNDETTFSYLQSLHTRGLVSRTSLSNKNLCLSVLMAIFPGEIGLASVITTKKDGSGGDNWSYQLCKAPVKSSPPTNQHYFLRAG